MKKENKKYLWITLIILGILLISSTGLIVWQVPYVVKEPHQECGQVQEPYIAGECDYISVPNQIVEKEEKEILNEEDIIIKSNTRFVRSIYLPEMANMELSFKADDSLNVWLINSEDWEIMKNSNYKTEPQNPLLKQINVKEGTFNRYVPNSDTYYLDIKNTRNFEDLVVFFVAIKTEQSVTKTTEENKKVCHDVTKYKSVRKCNNVEVEVTKYCNAWKKIVGMC